MDTLPLSRQEIDMADSFSSVADADFDEVESYGMSENAPERGQDVTRLFVMPRKAKAASWEADRWGQEEKAPDHYWNPVSQWSGSVAKRMFDCACVLISIPLILPIIVVTGLLVRLTSRGPVLFLQKRMGRHGRTFTIIKFRTMVHTVDSKRIPVTTTQNQEFTSVGPFLRRWKLDELPQIVNVLLGHMSLVGPRPKLPVHMAFELPCRPGITGLATIVFANEETFFARIPKDRLNDYYHSIVLPAKWKLDNDYMSRATFLSDLRLLVDSVLRRWDLATLNSLIIQSLDERSPGLSFEGLNSTGTFGNSAARASASLSAKTDELSVV